MEKVTNVLIPQALDNDRCSAIKQVAIRTFWCHQPLSGKLQEKSRLKWHREQNLVKVVILPARKVYPWIAKTQTFYTWCSSDLTAASS